MNIISFNPWLSLGMSGIKYLKAESLWNNIDNVKKADLILYPEYWMVNLLVYGLHKRIFPSIASYHLGHDKVEMTRVLQAAFPANVPYTRILAGGEECLDTIREEFYFPLVAKEVRNSMGQGVFLISNETELKDYLKRNEIVYVQEKLPVDRDLRVVYAGDDVLTAYWRIAAPGAFHNNISRGGDFSFADIPGGALDLVRKVAQTLGINHAGFDVAVVGDHYYIFEFNVMFGNEVINKMNIPLKETVYRYVEKMLGNE